MTRAWIRFTKSDASDRILWNKPYAEKSGKNRFDARIKMYKKYSFSDPSLDASESNIMVLDNRKDKSKPLPYNYLRYTLGHRITNILGL